MSKPVTNPKTTPKTILKLIACFVIPFLLVWGTQFLWFQNYYVPSASMENTLMTGDKVFAQNIITFTPKRGDIIVFQDKNNWLPKPDQKLVKRLIGLPGDTVACCTTDGKITINNQPYNEPYILGKNTPFAPQTVPQNEYFLLGDNREESADSAYHIKDGTQFISSDAFIAKVWVVWGWNFNWRLVE